MKPGIIVAIVIGAVVCCMLIVSLIVHRRVIAALIKGKPMPKAPKWHVWVKPENRRKS